MNANVVVRRAPGWCALLLLSMLAALGCEEERPYTPFQVATSLPEGPDPPPSSEETAPQAPSRSPGRLATPGQTKWRWGDIELEAPRGLAFSSGIELSDSTSKIILVWLLPKAPGDEAKGEKAGLYSLGSDGKMASTALARIPPQLPSGQDCVYSSELRQSGTATVASTLSVQCSQRSLNDTPTRSIAVIGPRASSPKLLEVLIAESAAGETMTVDVDSNDLDDDGNDDVELSFTLTSPKGARETLPVRWLTRTAGPSRQPNTPLAALAKRTTELSTWAVQKARRPRVPDQVDALRRLVSSLCNELGTSRVTLSSTDKVQCGNVWPHLNKLVQASVQANVGNKDLDRAIGEAVRFDWFAHKATDAEKKALAQLIVPAIHKVPWKQLARFDVALRTQGGPQVSPLIFGKDGQLWGHFADDKVRRLTLSGDPPLRPASPAPQSSSPDDTTPDPSPEITAPAWSLVPEGPGGRYLSAVVPSCERSEVQLAWGNRTGAPPPPTPIDLLAPRPGNCQQFSGVDVQAQVLGWYSGQLAVLIGGEIFLSGGSKPALNHDLALGTPWGILVRKVNGARVELLEVGDGAEHHHCVVAPTPSQTRKLACIKQNSVFVFSYSSSDGS